MASKVTTDDILNFNKLYFSCKNYSQVARETGFSPATVRKYVDLNWKPIDETKRKIFNPKELREEFDSSLLFTTKDLATLCILTEEEESEMKALNEELEA